MKHDLVGQTFGSLTAVSLSVKKGRWLCRCVCGQEWDVIHGNLIRARAKHCTCRIRERITIRKTTHNLSKSPEHQIWVGLRSRCNDLNAKAFPAYGGRGIVCDPRWNSFEEFLNDMGRRPSVKSSIERIDVNGPYSPKNCVWASRLTQANNKSNSHFVEFNGKRQTIAQWARDIGLSEDTLERRLNLLKWPSEKALSTPSRGWSPGKPKVRA